MSTDAFRDTDGSLPGMRTVLLVVLPILAAATLAGCGSEPSTATPASTPAITAPTSAVDTNRAACHAISEVNDASEDLNPAFTRPAAMVAMKAQYRRLADAGGQVLEATADVEAADDPRGEPNIALSRAWLEAADSCGDLYGDGPW